MKYAFIKENESQHVITRLCNALSVSTSGYYDWLHRLPRKQAQERKALLKTIVSIYTEVMENYGSPRMHIELIESGHEVSIVYNPPACQPENRLLDTNKTINRLNRASFTDM